MEITTVRLNARLKEVCWVGFKLGVTGFGGIAGMVAVMEDELVTKRKWIDQKHFLDVVSTANIVPGPNAVEIMMHCGNHRAGKRGLVAAGISYILPASLICMLMGYLYTQYGQLPRVQNLFFGIRPAITALILGTVYRLSKASLIGNIPLIILTALVFVGGLAGLNEVMLILSAGVLYYLYHRRNQYFSLPGLILLAMPQAHGTPQYSNAKLFLIFLKIGTILYGSGLVLFGYMNSAFVEDNHWLSAQQLVDTIAVGQITPGPILSSATFAGYLINGPSGAVLATAGIFLPSFFISFFLHKVLSSMRDDERIRIFLDGLNAASIAIIAVVGFQLLGNALEGPQTTIILLLCLGYTIMVKRVNPGLMILGGSMLGLALLSF